MKILKPCLVVLLLLLFQICTLPYERLENVTPGRVFIFDAEGNIYTDYRNYSIAKYSQDGKLLITFGQKGEGPSDFKRMGWFSINPIDHHIYTTEFFGGNHWISKFSTDGKYLGEWDCDFDWVKYSGISHIDFDSHGNVYFQAERPLNQKYKDFSLGVIEKSILKFSKEGKLVKEMYKMNMTFYADKKGKGNITIPFSNYLNWMICQDKLIVRELWGTSIKVYSLEGGLIKEIPLPFKREKVKSSDIKGWEEWLRSLPGVKEDIASGILDLNYWKSRIPFPEYMPLSGGMMYADSNGNLYSKKYNSYNVYIIGRSAFKTKNDNIWVKINLENSSAKIISFMENETLKGIWKQHLYFLKEDENDNFVLIRREMKETFLNE